MFLFLATQRACSTLLRSFVSSAVPQSEQLLRAQVAELCPPVKVHRAHPEQCCWARLSLSPGTQPPLGAWVRSYQLAKGLRISKCKEIRGYVS